MPATSTARPNSNRSSPPPVVSTAAVRDISGKRSAGSDWKYRSDLFDELATPAPRVGRRAKRLPHALLERDAPDVERQQVEAQRRPAGVPRQRSGWPDPLAAEHRLLSVGMMPRVARATPGWAFIAARMSRITWMVCSCQLSGSGRVRRPLRHLGRRAAGRVRPCFRRGRTAMPARFRVVARRGAWSPRHTPRRHQREGCVDDALDTQRRALRRAACGRATTQLGPCSATRPAVPSSAMWITYLTRTLFD